MFPKNKAKKTATRVFRTVRLGLSGPERVQRTRVAVFASFGYIMEIRG